ncbi:hypothetical protein CLOHAE12215_00022 [Clostridium haemolyticum]|nr:hypothetical protein CLOHAE12215_00022 [Clostridium haemolyticum]
MKPLPIPVIIFFSLFPLMYLTYKHFKGNRRK